MKFDDDMLFTLKGKYVNYIIVHSYEILRGLLNLNGFLNSVLGAEINASIL